MDDDARLELLHREHAGAVRAYVRRRIGAEDADDVVAEVFVVAWRRLADVPDEPRTWLLGIARKALGNRRRTDRRQRALLERLAEEAGTGVAVAPAPGASVVPGDGALLRALAALPSRDREVLLLVTWDGLDHAEAAEVLGIRPGTVAMRVLRARRRLGRALGHDGDGAADSRAVPTADRASSSTGATSARGPVSSSADAAPIPDPASSSPPTGPTTNPAMPSSPRGMPSDHRARTVGPALPSRPRTTRPDGPHPGATS